MAFIILNFNSLLIRSKKGANKKNRIAVMMSENFMRYHNISLSIYGFVWAYRGRSSYRRVLFLNEEYNNTGTLLHEMRHTAGQLKEFYKEFYDKQQNYPVLCKKFNDSTTEVLCWNQYFIKSGLKAKLGSSFKWITGNNIQSIMDNNLDLKKIWIDRETFQKAFRFLKTSSSISKREKEFKSYPKLLISGF